MNNKYVMRFDGCSKKNPGLGAAGAVIYNNEEEIWSGHEIVGENTTNNIAEYHGLLLGYRNAILQGIINLHIEGDSLLIIKQMKGEYKVSASHLYDLYEQAKNFEKQFNTITYEHIYRNKNKRADELANQAIEQYNSNKHNSTLIKQKNEAKNKKINVSIDESILYNSDADDDDGYIYF
jgi:probable phosphoglycerate mutase